MRKVWQARWVMAAAMALALASSAAAQWGWDSGVVAEGRFEKSLTVNGAVDLEVKTNWGGIQVRTGDGSTVRVVGIIKARKYSKSDAEARIAEIVKNPPITQTGNTIVVGFESRDWDSEERNRIGITFELVVPVSTRLRSSTGSGSMDIAGIAGPLDGSTGSGSITLAKLGGEARVSTGSGSIHLDGVKGALRASTGSGSIRGTGIAGAINANTGSGTIELEQVSPGSVETSTGSGGITLTGIKGGLRARTGSGSIRVEGEPAGDWSVRTASGTIRVRVPSTASFDLAASTSSGSITTDHPVTLQGRFGRKEIHGKVRNGGPLLDLNTSSGSIYVE